MIITVNGNQHTVQIEKDFSPKFQTGIKASQLFNGSFYFTDRGVGGDKMYSKFKISGLTNDINSLVDDLYLEDSTITLNCEDYEKIFGPGYNYAATIICVYDFKVYDIESIETSILEIEVRANQLSFLSGQNFIVDFIRYPVKRVIETAKNSFLSLKQDDFGGRLRDTNTKVDGSGYPTKAEIATVEYDLKDSEAKDLFLYIRSIRDNSFLFQTNSHFEVFLNKTDSYVKVLDLKMKPNGIGFWVFTVTLILDKQWQSTEYSIAGSTTGTGVILFTDDNADTLKEYTGLNVNMNALEFSGLSFVASSSNDRLLVSKDNYKFIDTLGFPMLDSVQNIVCGNGRIICNQLTNGGYYSDNYGETWTYISPSNQENNIYQSCYFDGYYYFAARSTVDNFWRIYRSQTGINSYTLVYTTDSTDSYATMECASFGIALVSNTSIFKTTDGTSWSKTTTTQICDSASASGDGKLVFIGNNYSLVTTDLTTFNLYSIGFSGPTAAHTGMTYDGKNFISDGLISPDGQNWSALNTSTLTGTFKIASTYG